VQLFIEGLGSLNTPLPFSLHLVDPHMKSQFRLLCATLFSLPLLASANLHAQEIWSGSAVSFSKANGGSTSLPSNQDRLTPQTWLARADTAGIFNIVTETGFGGGSPANTRWAVDLPGNGNTGLAMLASNYAALTFESCRDALRDFQCGRPNRRLLSLRLVERTLPLTLPSLALDAG
jgi:hypothetical protein